MQIAMKPRMTVVKNTLMAFSTPIQQMKFENTGEFNAEIARRVVVNARRLPRRDSNMGGWHSDSHFLQNLGEPYANQLVNMFMQGVHATLDASSRHEPGRA